MKYTVHHSKIIEKKAKVLSAANAVSAWIRLPNVKGERFGVLALDKKHIVIKSLLFPQKKSVISDDLSREIMLWACKLKAHAVIGFRITQANDSAPKQMDVAFAEKLVVTAKEKGLVVFDYVVAGHRSVFSLLECTKLSDTCAKEVSCQLTLSSLLEERPENWPPVISTKQRLDKDEVKPLWAIDLFAGCGGLSLGLEQAGFTPLLVCEVNKDAMATYLENRKHYAHGITRFYDVHSITDERLTELSAGWKKLGIDEIDLIAGGPPCQGYSGIGHRRSYKVEKEEIPSNHLFKEMARIISKLRPKMFLFENVKGLLSAHWTSTGEKGEIWQAVLQAFKMINNGEYFVDFKLVQAKDYGVPQNRPRVLMVGIRKDLGWSPAKEATASGLLPEKQGTPPTVEDLLSDLIDERYLDLSVTTHYPYNPKTKIQKQLRVSSDGESILRKGAPLTEQEYSMHKPHIREKFQYMIDHHGAIPEHMKTKKFAQRVLPRTWGASGPTMTVTSLPEDYVHYEQPRALTVREWARLQMFPDWYQFKGPRTTGGIRRAGNPHKGVWEREAPKYTQIGNAVPVELARKVGAHLASILKGLPT